MSDENSGDSEGAADWPATDLLGDPFQPPRDPRGRPKYRVKKENRELVATLVADGWKQERIARHLGIDPKTLREYFPSELSAGADMVRAAIVAEYWKLARAGKLGALHALKEMAEAGQVHVPPPREDRPAKPEPLGKKEKLDQDAKDPPKGWGDILGGGGVH